MFDGALGTGASRRRIMEPSRPACAGSTPTASTSTRSMQDTRTPEEEKCAAHPRRPRDPGQILYYGCSNYAAYRLVQSDAIAERRGYKGSRPCRPSTAWRSGRWSGSTSYMKQTGMESCPGRPSRGGCSPASTAKKGGAGPARGAHGGESWKGRLEAFDTPATGPSWTRCGRGGGRSRRPRGPCGAGTAAGPADGGLGDHRDATAAQLGRTSRRPP
ncbi:MAG: hypothetical protein R3F43_05895 [bacterium]